jgi:hypothetical protein
MSSQNDFPHLYSYSQLNTYKDCGVKYRKYYLENNKKREVTQATEIGSLVHSCIENFYLGEAPSAGIAFEAVISNYLEERKIDKYYYDLQEISHFFNALYYRASAEYKGRDAIRTADGGIPKNPTMTRVWKDEVKRSGIDQKIDDINNEINYILPDSYASIKMATVYSEAEFLAKRYKHPTLIKEVSSIEFGFSVPDHVGDPTSPDPEQQVPHIKNLATLPNGAVFRGFIDLVGKLADGSTIIVDHKTSSGEPPSELKVKHHEQLLLYAFFWNQLTGEWPSKIGISHLRSGTLVTANVNQEMAIQAALRHSEVVEAIGKNVFLKNAPFEFGSPCLGREGTLATACPYLPECHRSVAVSLGWVDPRVAEAMEEDDDLSSFGEKRY